MIEGFDSILSTLRLAKELDTAGRPDIVKEQFFDTLSWDACFENTVSTIMSIFSECYNDYDDMEGVERYVFSDDCISRYYEHARTYGRKNKVRYEDNPIVKEAEAEVNDHMSFCFSVMHKLLGYTKTRRTAKQSKLVILVAPCDCDNYDGLARALVRIYQWFTDRCAELDKQEGVKAA
jgi:hypothetical protein